MDGDRVGAGLGGDTARQDCDGSRLKVGQASDQASGDGDQAGAGSLRALRGKGTSPTAGHEWATRAASASLPRTGTDRATKVIARTAGYDPSHSPHRAPALVWSPGGHRRQHHSYEPPCVVSGNARCCCVMAWGGMTRAVPPGGAEP
jgi:hypothetical protein